jgi:opacity protein-like surface antigen
LKLKICYYKRSVRNCAAQKEKGQEMARTLIWANVFFGFLLGAIAMAPRVALSQALDWGGIYIQGQAGFGLGEHTLSYEHEDYGLKADIYDIPLEGKAQAIGLGYRHELGDSNFYLGARLMAHHGKMKGSESWSGMKGNVGGEVNFASDTVYSAGIELGYAFTPRWYSYVIGGIAGAELSWRGQVHAFGHETSHNEEGWAPGTHLALGVMRDLGNNWALGGEAQWFHFQGEESVRGLGHDLGSFKAEVDDFRLMLTLTKTF